MRIYYTDEFVLPLPPGHRFPMSKYERLRQEVQRSGIAPPHVLCVPPGATDAQLELAHDAAYVRRVASGELTLEECRRIGFPWSPGMVERSRRSVGATIAATRSALDDGVSVSLAGGTHHALADRGEGYCVFNDVAVAVRVVRAETRFARAAVVDTDVHQGNGTAALFRGDDAVFTFSVHGAANFPFRKESGDLDIALQDGAGDDEYLSAVFRGVEAALATGPGVVYYIAGADAHEDDRLGRLRVSEAALAERDRVVIGRAREAGAAVVVVMGGGYGRDIDTTVSVHLASVRSAASFAAAPATSTSR